MNLELLTNLIVNKLRGVDRSLIVTPMDREKYRTEVTRYIMSMTGLAKNTVDTRLAEQSKFKSLEILSLKQNLLLSWDEVSQIFSPDMQKLKELEQRLMNDAQQTETGARTG